MAGCDPVRRYSRGDGPDRRNAAAASIIGKSAPGRDSQMGSHRQRSDRRPVCRRVLRIFSRSRRSAGLEPLRGGPATDLRRHHCRDDRLCRCRRDRLGIPAWGDSRIPEGAGSPHLGHRRIRPVESDRARSGARGGYRHGHRAREHEYLFAAQHPSLQAEHCGDPDSGHLHPALSQPRIRAIGLSQLELRPVPPCAALPRSAGDDPAQPSRQFGAVERASFPSLDRAARDRAGGDLGPVRVEARGHRLRWYGADRAELRRGRCYHRGAWLHHRPRRAPAQSEGQQPAGDIDRRKYAVDDLARADDARIEDTGDGGRCELAASGARAAKGPALLSRRDPQRGDRTQSRSHALCDARRGDRE